jgi:hypothetical protein
MAQWLYYHPVGTCFTAVALSARGVEPTFTPIVVRSTRSPFDCAGAASGYFGDESAYDADQIVVE